MCAMLGCLACPQLTGGPAYSEVKTSSRDALEGTAVHGHSPPDHWTYTEADGPEHWAMLSPAYTKCETGSHQSPVEIRRPPHGHIPELLVFHYRPTPLRIMNNGHSVQVTYQRGSELHLNGRAYRLEQFHFHAPSEHHVDGVTYPMEAHLVHRDSKGRIVVLGVLMALGQPNPALALVWGGIPPHGGEVDTGSVLNAKDLLPASTHHHYSYQGSLTTPPCTEGVQWIVIMDPVRVSDEQVRHFVMVIGQNARPPQPLHDRRIVQE
jgi:carbonic anhydrase